ncbi:MAG TPA: GNVR domain-containing protein [Terriglobales bacterium]|nr:GNVR domain-containing protein [Terriglobales bacterium]
MSYISGPQAGPNSNLQPIYELEAPAAAAPRRGEVGNALYRHRWLGAGLVVFFVALGAAATWWVRPWYQATASIIISHPSLHAAELTPVEYPPPVDPDREMQTELIILSSRAVGDPVIASLNLEQRDPEIQAAIAQAQRRRARDKKAPVPTLSAADRTAIAFDVFSSKLTMAPNKLSSTVDLSYGSHDPAIAAAVANATADSFMRQTLVERGQQGQAATSWMERQVQQAIAELGRDDAAVANFQQAHNYIPLGAAAGAGGASGLLNRLADANHAWSAAEAERIGDQAAEASYANGVVAALPAELRDPAIDRAVENVGAAEAQLTALETTYQPGFPLVVEAEQQLGGAQQKLAALRTQVAEGLRQRLAASTGRAQALGALVDSLGRQAAAASSLEMQFGVLKSRADAERTLVDTLRQKLAELSLEASLPPSNIAVLDRALVPSGPVYPRLGLDLALGLGLGLVVGVGTVLARERVGDTLTAPAAAVRGLGPALAPLGMIAEQTRPEASLRALPAPGAGGVLPGWAKIGANLVARCGAPPRAILVASANRAEGKTTAVCQLGLALAHSGWRTLVVDAALRAPACHCFFGQPNASGLLAAQSGRKFAPLALAPHLDLVPCEDGAAQPLQPRALASLLEHWREHYDYVLVDSDAGRSSGEAVLLSALVDGVVVVLRWGRTRMSEAQQLAEELARAHAPLLGTVFNRADRGAPAFRPWKAA